MGRVDEAERIRDSKASMGIESDRRERCGCGGVGGLYVEEVAVKSRREDKETGVG
jgi:hypothetical protein